MLSCEKQRFLFYYLKAIAKYSVKNPKSDRLLLTNQGLYHD
ncbi:MAG: hypothetical protein ACRC80_37640 [Waterburya sp.]